MPNLSTRRINIITSSICLQCTSIIIASTKRSTRKIFWHGNCRLSLRQFFFIPQLNEFLNSLRLAKKVVIPSVEAGVSVSHTQQCRCYSFIYICVCSTKAKLYSLINASFHSFISGWVSLSVSIHVRQKKTTQNFHNIRDQLERLSRSKQVPFVRFTIIFNH